jgi:uncharacterized protein YdeI (YjbR/CyaY-like superfamily)
MRIVSQMEPLFFAHSRELRDWLTDNVGTAREAWVGLYKKGSGRPSITWPELVDQLLCFGWIDGVRKSLGEDAYMIRVTPRKSASNWSAVNLRRFPELMEQELVQPEGMAAWNARQEDKARQYSYEREHAALGEEFEAHFRARAEAWKFFQEQPPSYRRSAIAWVMTAKREETRRRRLDILVADSGQARRIGVLRRE